MAMKTKRTLWLATSLLLTSTWCAAQSHIMQVFQQIQERKDIEMLATRYANNGVDHSWYGRFQTDTSKDDLINLVKEAFLADQDQAYQFYSVFEPTEQADRRATWSIQMVDGDSQLMGTMPGSSFAVVCFASPSDTNRRTAYACEWWETTKPGRYEVRLVESYCPRPSRNSPSLSPLLNDSTLRDLSININGASFDVALLDSLVNGNELTRIYPGMNVDSLLNAHGLDKKFTNTSIEKINGDNVQDFFSGFPRRHPDGLAISSSADTKKWVLKAYSQVRHLNSSDWFRLFSLLTRMLSEDKGSDNDRVVAAGMVLDLCKNVPPEILNDKDERELCISQLHTVSSLYQKKDKYVHDILELSARKIHH